MYEPLTFFEDGEILLKVIKMSSKTLIKNNIFTYQVESDADSLIFEKTINLLFVNTR